MVSPLYPAGTARSIFTHDSNIPAVAAVQLTSAPAWGSRGTQDEGDDGRSPIVAEVSLVGELLPATGSVGTCKHTYPWNHGMAEGSMAGNQSAPNGDPRSAQG